MLFEFDGYGFKFGLYASALTEKEAGVPISKVIEGMGKGEILLINQFARHEIEAAGQNDIIINFIIKTEFFGRLMSLFDENNIISRFILSAINGRKKHGEHIHFKVGEIDAIQSIMHVIISEIYSNNSLKEIRVNFLVGLLMTSLS